MLNIFKLILTHVDSFEPILYNFDKVLTHSDLICFSGNVSFTVVSWPTQIQGYFKPFKLRNVKEILQIWYYV